MASDSTMPEAEIHHEIGRRTIQISDLKEELWDLRDRVEESDQRSDNLVQGLTQKASEICVRKSKANELEDKVALLEGQGEEVVRRLKRAAEDAASGLERLRKQLGKVEERHAATIALENAAAQSAEILRAEGPTMNAEIEAARRELAHERHELAQDEAALAARQARTEKAFEQQEAEALEVSEKELAAVTLAAAEVRSQVSSLEKILDAEKASIASMQNSLDDSSGRSELVRLECNALEDELASLEAQTQSRSIDDELQATRRNNQLLQQQVAIFKNERDFRRQSLQGALDETRRMLKDQLDSIQEAPPDPGIKAIMEALAGARQQAEDSKASVARLEMECSTLQAQVDSSEASASEVAKQAPSEQQRHYTALTLELRAGEQALKAASRRADDKAVEAVRAEAKVIDAEKMAKQKEAILKQKLHDLWKWLRTIN